MKTKFSVALLILIGFFTSCKDEKSIDNLKVVTPEEVDTSFKVTLKAIVKKQDDFALFYTEDGSINFFDVKPIWMGVKPSETEQDITFSLPEDVYPTQLRLDLGLNKDQEDIIIKGITFSYKGKKFEAMGANFFNYFRADENQCTADVATGTIKAVVKDGVRKGPSLYPHEVPLSKELQNLGK
ncbi:MAG: hypothetical protein J0L86_04010 [Flavobacteriales bacterium]|nr:hypothetical protein [Flavobacteriales bacterium]